MKRALYIYWKLPEAQGTQAIAAVHAMQHELAQAHAALRCLLHRRADVREGLLTLMETYASADGVSPTTQAAIAAAAARHLAPWAGAQRHTEVFESLSD